MAEYKRPSKPKRRPKDKNRKYYTRPKDVSRYSLAQRLRLGIKPEYQSDIGMQRKSLPIEERINLGSGRTRGRNIAGKYVGSGDSRHTYRRGLGDDKQKYATEEIERANARRELVKDRELIKKYGKDAMKARSFNTVRDYAIDRSTPEIVQELLDPPRTYMVNMKKGGKVRGAGIAKQGVRKCKMR
jgi:hypothetical protein